MSWGCETWRTGRDGQLARYTFGRLKRITFDISIGQSGFLLDIRRGIIADSCRKALRAPRALLNYSGGSLARYNVQGNDGNATARKVCFSEK